MTNENILPHGWFNDTDISTYRTLISQVPEQGTIAEIGVWQGRSLCSAADVIKRRKLNVIAVDVFTGTLSEPDLLESAKKLDIKQIFLENILRFGIAEKTEVYDAPSLKAANMVEDRSLDLIFVDAEHTYEAVLSDIEAWKPKLKPNGIMAGHDYFQEQVKRAVENSKLGTIIQHNNIWVYYEE